MAGNNELTSELRRQADERKDPTLLAAAREIERLRAEKARLQSQVHNQRLSRRIDSWWNGSGE